MTTRCYEDDSDDLTMRELLLLADEQQTEPSRELVERTRTALHQRRTGLASPVATRSPSRWARRAALLSFSAAVVVMIAMLLTFQSFGTAWARVAKAVRGKPWIHFSAVRAGGKRFELWMSFPRDVAALRSDDLSRYEDFRTGVCYEYAPGDNKVLRLSTGDTGALRSMASVFQAIFQGNASVGERFADFEIAKQRKRTLDEQDPSWVEYELELRRADRNDSALVVIRVDPDEMLPVSLTLTASNEKMEFAIDYPEEGPADIYSLGVPRDAPFEDRLPPADLNRILEVIDQGRRDLDNYAAVCSTGGVNFFVWRKGDKWRVDVAQEPEFIEPNTDLERWGRECLKERNSRSYLVCDGQGIYECDVRSKEGQAVQGSWKLVRRVWRGEGHIKAQVRVDSALSMIELRAYPTNLTTRMGSWPQVTARLNPSDKNGPDGSILVDMTVLGQEHRYWIDPDRRYVLVKEQMADLNSDSDGKQWIWEYDGFRQSPRGVWYPTIVRWKTEHGVQAYYYYLDFNVELPDELFTRTALRDGPKPSNN